MGNCPPISLSEDKLKETDHQIRTSIAIDKKLKRNSQNDGRIQKLLLLGSGESGKSTFFKQIRVLYQSGFTEEERPDWKHVVHTNILQVTKTLLEGQRRFSIEHPSSGFELSSDRKESAEVVFRICQEWEASESYGPLRPAPELTADIGSHIRQLWEDPAIQLTFSQGNQLQLLDCAEYFLNIIDRVTQPGYLPSTDDILHARVKTTGVVESIFRPAENRNEEMYKIVDVGGQRNERRKWLHQFDTVNAIIFCVALSEYDQMLSEDDSVNRMMESKHLFESTLLHAGFENMSFILFLNKFDLFQKKVLKSPLTVCEWFSDYKPNGTDVDEVEHAYKFVERKFVQLFQEYTPPENTVRIFQVYRTTAVDSGNVQETFQKVDKALKRLLEKAKERQRLVNAGMLSTGYQVMQK